ncbi:hypothetical protein K8R43_06620 [archaeon]|nr:hypothetical protein [archaeon]
MTYRNLIHWYREQLHCGVPRKEIREALRKEGLPSDVIEDLEAKAEGRKSIHGTDFTKWNPPELAQAVQHRNLKDFVEIVPTKVLLSTIAFLLLLIFGFLIFPLVVGFFTPVDDLPPKIALSSSETYLGSVADVDLKCVDEGADFVSGCDNSSFLVYFSAIDSCPSDYSEYSNDITPKRDGFVCVAAKDLQNNTGFSKPFRSKFDLILPETSFTGNNDWIEENFTLVIKDSDHESGLKECFYYILTSDSIQNATLRPCNAAFEVLVKRAGCFKEGRGACNFTAYAFDNVGNKGEEAEYSFNIDFNNPIAVIESVTNSNKRGKQLLVEGTVEFIGSAFDHNIKSYKLEYNGLLSKTFKTGNENVHSSVLGSLDTTKLPDSTYTIILTIEDFSGKTSSTQITIEVNNTYEPFTEPEEPIIEENVTNGTIGD